MAPRFSALNKADPLHVKGLPIKGKSTRMTRSTWKSCCVLKVDTCPGPFFAYGHKLTTGDAPCARRIYKIAKSFVSRLSAMMHNNNLMRMQIWTINEGK